MLAEAVMEAEVAEQAGAAYGERSPERITRRNRLPAAALGHARRQHRAANPKLRQGSYFPACSSRAGAPSAPCSPWSSKPTWRASRTRRVDDLVRSLGCEGISRSPVSRICSELDTVVTSFLERPLDGGPYRYLRLDALTQRVREEGRIAQVSPAGYPRVRGWGRRHRRQRRRQARGAGH